jgi:phospholipid transport system substrate-binding protein
VFVHVARIVSHHQVWLTEQISDYVVRSTRFRAWPNAAPPKIHFVTRPHRDRGIFMTRIVLLPVFVALIFAAPGQLAAQDVPQILTTDSAKPVATDHGSPEHTINDLNAALIKIMQAGHSMPFAKRAEILRPVVEQTFDLPLLLRNSVGGLRWPGLPDDQKAKLLDLFAQFTVASYVANFDAFSGEKFVIAQPLRKVENDIVVPTRMMAPNGDPTKLDYVLHDDGNSWRVVDILLDGTISRVAVTRSDFRALITSGDASKLIESLRGKIANLTDGSAS